MRYEVESMELCNFIENVINNNPIIVVGSGSSMAAGISGMKELSTHLKENVKPFNDIDQREWDEIVKLLDSGMGLEESLQSRNLSEDLTSSIVEETWKCISIDEKFPLLKIASGEDLNGFIRYFRRYQHTSNQNINIITTNYDQILEWSIAYVGLNQWDGFDNGVIAKPINLVNFERKMREFINGKLNKLCYVRIFKPHGSLNWFQTKKGEFVKLNGVNHHDYYFLKENNLKPVIVTPGVSKYLQTHNEPYNQIFTEMNRCIRNAKGMVFYGFGFNDDHIQGYFKSVMVDNHIPKLILSKSLSDAFFKITDRGEIRNFVAIQEEGVKSNIYSDKLTIDNFDKELWSFSSILDLAWGEEHAVYS